MQTLSDRERNNRYSREKHIQNMTAKTKTLLAGQSLSG